ncbi:TPA: hypothetical protein ACG0T4_003085 [Enterobacter hormaechei]
MSNIDKQAAQAVADLKAGYTLWHADVEIIQQMALDAVTLQDELEAKDNRINRLEAIVAVAEQRNALMREWKRALKVPCDLVDDQVPVVIHGMVIRLERLKETEAKLEAAEKRIAEQREIMRQAASDISYAIFNLTGSDLSRLNPGVVETTDPTDTALIAERNLRAAAAGKGEAS